MSIRLRAHLNIWNLFVRMNDLRDIYAVCSYEGHSWMYRQKRRDFGEIYATALNPR